MQFNVGVLIVSDTCAVDRSLDKTSAAIREYLAKYNGSESVSKFYEVTKVEIVPDDAEKIQAVVRQWANCVEEKFHLILTSGGTGFTDRDITPEAVKVLLERDAPGITHKMLSESLQITPFAMMARPVAGTIRGSVVITLPGSPKGAIENLNAVIPTLGHALSQVGARDARALHSKMERTLHNAPPGNGDAPQAQASVAEFQRPMPSERGHVTHESHVTHGSHGHHHHGADASQFEVKTKKHDTSCGVAKHALVSNDPRGPVTLRARSSPYPMISMDEAFRMIQAEASAPVAVELDIRTQDAVGYVLAEDVYSPVNVPDFRASIVDGYAVRTADGPGVYKVVSISHASPTNTQHVLQPGEISRITTGAPIPQGADAIVMVEETRLVSTKDGGAEELEVEILARDVKPDDNVRDLGSDIAAGELILAKGSVVSASGGEVGVLSSMGISTVKVFKKPLIGVLSTGDELVDTLSPWDALQYGQIFDCNRPTLLSAVANSHHRVVDLKIASDSEKSLEKLIQEAFAEHDLDYLITTGGVSMGEMDLLKPIIERVLGGDIHFGRVTMKPGKPTTFATFEHRGRKRTVFALPGNPASATVCFYLFVLPSLRLFAGYSHFAATKTLPSLPRLRAKLEAGAKLDPRPEFQRVYTYQDASGQLWARNTGFQRSSRIASFRDANSLAALPGRAAHGSSTIAAHSDVDVLLFGTIGGYV